MAGIESWTDLDYAQAAIDMLPGSVEEIRDFLTQQRIGNWWVNCECPIQRWVQKWIDNKSGGLVMGIYDLRVDWCTNIRVPAPVTQYILWVDAPRKL